MAMIVAVVPVIAVAIALAVGTSILAGSSEAADCASLPGAQAAGVRTLNISATTNVASTCYRIVNIPTTTYTPQTVTTTTWSTGKAQCIANGTDAGACNTQRAAEVARLTAAGYQNLKQIGGCEPSIFRAADGYLDGRNGLQSTNASTFEGTAVARSMPNATYANSTLGYCFGRAWVAGPSLVYVTAWSISTNTTSTIQVPHVANVPTNQSYACTIPTTTYRLTNVSYGSGAALPDSWAEACYETQERTAAGWQLLGIVVIVMAAAAVLGILRFFGVWTR